MACKRRSASPLTTPAPPDDLGPNGALKTPTHKATQNRLVLLAVLNHAPPIAALRGEMLIFVKQLVCIVCQVSPIGSNARKVRGVPKVYEKYEELARKCTKSTNAPM